MNLDAIKARLGSISATVFSTLPPAVKRLLHEDIIQLLKAIEASDNARFDLGAQCNYLRSKLEETEKERVRLAALVEIAAKTRLHVVKN